ncbi:MAG: 2-hydroxyacid dehydrogenase [Alphaproteobacteria bacterium]
MKAVLQYRASTGFVRQLEDARPDWLELAIVDEADKALFAREMADADVLLHVLEPITQAVIEAAPALKLIQKIGVGVNTIDLEAAAAQGVAVANMPGTNSQAVAEQTLMLMLAALRRTVDFDRQTRAGKGWRMAPDVFDQTGEIAGRTVGLVGYGAIPQVLAPVLKTLGAEIIYTATGPKDDAVGTYRPLSDLLERADIVSLHVPLTADTEKMVDAVSLARMKPGAVLVNTARGGLVDEAALVDALRSGQLRAAGLDVFAEEPVDPNNPLLSLNNVVLAPHTAWLTPETLARSIGVCVENCRRVRDGEVLLHRVV